MKQQPEKTIEEVIAEDGRYCLEAVQFVREGLSYAVEIYHPQKQSNVRKHVGGAQLCEGMRLLALKRWGFLAFSVLASWNIHATRDFGEIVFLLVNSGWMQKEHDDELVDFDNVFDFAESLKKQFRIDTN